MRECGSKRSGALLLGKYIYANYWYMGPYGSKRTGTWMAGSEREIDIL